MSSPDGNLLEFLTNRFDESYDATKADALSCTREAKWRRLSAYALKAMAVFGGISIAAGLRGAWSQIVGILITLAVAVDALFSNHKRLLVVTAASHAYTNLLSNIKQSYNRQLAAVLKLRETDPNSAKSKLEKLINDLMSQLQNEHKQIIKGLQDADLKLLNSISLEQRAAELAHGGQSG